MAVRLSEQFEKMSSLYTAIKDIDNIIADTNNVDDKLDRVANAIKEINKSEFSKETEESIIREYRKALYEIYSKLNEDLNNGISNS